MVDSEGFQVQKPIHFFDFANEDGLDALRGQRFLQIVRVRVRKVEDLMHFIQGGTLVLEFVDF